MRRALLILPIGSLAGLLMPALVIALSVWTWTVDPLMVAQGQDRRFDLRLQQGGGLTDIGCLRLSLPSEFKVRTAVIVATSNGAEWRTNISQSGTRVMVYAKEAGGRLTALESVDFRLFVDADEAGLFAWVGEAYQRQDCGGTSLTTPVAVTITVTANLVSPSPTPTVSSAPTTEPSTQPSTEPTAKPTTPPSNQPTTQPTALPSTRPSNQATTQPSVTPAPASSGSPEPTPSVQSTPSPLPLLPTEPPAASPAARPSNGTGQSPTPPIYPAEAPPPPSSPPAVWADGQTSGAQAADTPGSALGAGLASLTILGSNEIWFVPALLGGVPGLLIVLLVAANVLLGVSWLPGIGRLLGPEPAEPDEDQHIWWAAGRPMYG